MGLEGGVGMWRGLLGRGGGCRWDVEGRCWDVEGVVGKLRGEWNVDGEWDVEGGRTWRGEVGGG